MGEKRGSRNTIHPVILSGGSGMRLWPLSRELYPKQLLPLHSERSMLQETALRVRGGRFADPLIVCNAEHRFIVAEQLRELGITPAATVLEPVGRDTAPAAALAALFLVAADEDAIMVVLPSDHVIRRPAPFRAAIATAAKAAGEGALVTFGIPAQGPETGYGYIRRGQPWAKVKGCFRVAAFVEKPNLATANRYLRAGGYDWNSGIFLFRAARYLAELERLRPAMLKACRRAFDRRTTDLDFLRVGERAFRNCQSQSIDYAVMEHTAAAAVVPVEMGWSDVGSWSALWEIGEKDADGNLISGDVVVRDVKNSYIRGEGPLVAAVGLEDAVIVVTDDAVLATTRSRSQQVRAIVETLKKRDRSEHLAHSTVYRPWGHYQTVDVGDGFQVKHLMVKPGAKLSLQMHRHRAEHWVVVSGTARVTRGDEVFTLSENQSAYIPVATKHRLENPGKRPLRVIEVQSGSYLGEDDIVRFDDAYGRG